MAHSGDPAILLHGLGSRAEDLRDVAELLPGRDCVLPDLRGHGEAPARSVRALADYAADVAGLVEEHGPGLALVGFSLGAWVALEAWRSSPPAFETVVLVDPPADPEPLLRWAREGTRDDREARRRLVALYHETDPARARALMAEHPLTRDLQGAALERNVESLLSADRDTLLQTLAALEGWSPPPRPPGSCARAVVLRGTRSVACPPAAASALAARLGGEAATYDGGHAAHLSAPDEVARELRRVLD